MSKTKKIIIGVSVGAVVIIATISVILALFAFNVIGGKVISEAEAKQIAFTHAEVSEADTKMLNVRLDNDDFKKNYDIEFYVGTAEYNYEIDAKTGHIEDFDVDGLRIEQPQVQTAAGTVEEVPTQGQEATISEAEAARIVLAKIPGASESDLWIKTDIEDGLLVYEGKVIYDGIEYEFEMDANEGTMYSWESDRAEADDVPRGQNFSETNAGQ